MPLNQNLINGDSKSGFAWRTSSMNTSGLLQAFLTTLRRHSGASAVCLWVQAAHGMRLVASDPGDLPHGEVVPEPGGSIGATADDGVLRLITDPSSFRGFELIPLLADRIRSEAVAILPVGTDRTSSSSVVTLHLAELPDEPAQILFDWSRWTHLLELILEPDSENLTRSSPYSSGQNSGTLNHATSLQSVSGGLARRVDEKLSQVLPALQQVRRLTDEHDPSMRFLRYIEEGLDRTRELLVKLQAFSGMGPLIAESVSMADCAAESIRRLEPVRPAEIKLTASIPQGLPMIVADRVQVVAAIIEVARNGIEAAPDGTEVEITLDCDEEGIKVEVTDEGVGMTHEVIEQATQPFFSTRDPSTHSGLGLSTAQGCIHRHGGRLTISSQIGVGTKVTLWFPLRAHVPVI
jgi:signal transduction histidine kinase